MQALSTTEATWYFVSKEPEAGIPPRITITSPFRVGRREGFDLCLDCRNVSGLHAELTVESGQLWIDDLNSTNGTFVNNARIRQRSSLKDGDTVQFGQSVFTVVCHSGGRDAVESVDPVAAAAAPAPESTEERFERLLKNGVTPFFQPIYNIAGESRERIGYEVLGRSRLFGLRTPDEMFAIATDLDKESELSRTLRTRGIEAAASFQSDMMLFVNTHPSEMEYEEIQDSLKEMRSKFAKRPIMLELPEKVLYTPEHYAELIKVVKDLGVQLVLHDFGAGQIRLAELAEFAPDVVKFDCALLQGIDKADQKRRRLVAAMVKMVTELGITPMAEYVETEAEHKALKELGFELAQGFYYGHPAQIETLIDGLDSAETVAKANKAPSERPVEKLKELEEEVNSDLVSEEGPTVITSVKSLGATGETKPTYKDAQWIMDRDDTEFTIQLMFSANQQEAEKFVANRTQPGDYVIYRKWSSNHEWYVVVFGIFDVRLEAQSAIEQFSGTGHSSWVRQLDAVKEEIRSAEKVGE